MKTPQTTRPAVSRRQFLRGTGGFSLALPVLPSLLPARADAAPRMPRFFLMATEHAGVTPETMFPAETLLTEKVEIRPGHEARHGKLVLSREGNDAVLSGVLRGPAANLTQRIADRMNVLQGISVPFDLGHNTGGALGNYNRTNRESLDKPDLFVPTIDQVMAWSPSFYQGNAFKMRSILAGQLGNLSYNWSSPTTRSGLVQSQAIDNDSLKLFDAAIGKPAATGEPRRPVVDRVIEQYRSLRTSNRRLSPGDKQALDDYMDRLAELEGRLTRTVSCGNTTRPTESSKTYDKFWHGDPVPDARKSFSLLNDVIAAAFICGSSRVAVYGVLSRFVTNGLGDWHHEVAHKAHTNQSSQELLARSHRETFNATLLDLALKLDVDDGVGGRVLDDTLLVWAQESGYPSHDYTSTPIVTIGGAAGAFNTGLYCDYRNRVVAARRETGFVGSTPLYEYAGLLHMQWLANVLDAMGVPRDEWPKPSAATGHGTARIGFGYGRTIIDDSWMKNGKTGTRLSDAYIEQLLAYANQPLPFVYRTS